MFLCRQNLGTDAGSAIFVKPDPRPFVSSSGHLFLFTLSLCYFASNVAIFLASACKSPTLARLGKPHIFPPPQEKRRRSGLLRTGSVGAPRLQLCGVSPSARGC